MCLTWCRAGIRGPGGRAAGHGGLVTIITSLLVTRAPEARVSVLTAELALRAGILCHAGEVPHAAGPDVHGLEDLRKSDHSLVKLNIAETALEHGTGGLNTLSDNKAFNMLLSLLSRSSNRK